MPANTTDFKAMGPAGGGTSRFTSGTKVTDSAVQAGAEASIKPGDLVRYENGYWAKVDDEGAATAGKYGVAQSKSSETVSEDGLVTVEYHPAGLLAKAVPHTPGNLAQGILGDAVVIDVTDGVQTVDEDNAAGVLTIVDYNDTSGQETVTVLVPYNSTPA